MWRGTCRLPLASSLHYSLALPPAALSVPVPPPSPCRLTFATPGYPTTPGGRDEIPHLCYLLTLFPLIIVTANGKSAPCACARAQWACARGAVPAVRTECRWWCVASASAQP